MPSETTFQQSIGKKLFPGFLTGELRQDALHDEKRKRGTVLNPQNCGSREDTLPRCLQNTDAGKAASIAGAALLHPLFQYVLVQELANTPDDVTSFVGHLRVEVDVGEI